MTRDQILEMAKQAGLATYSPYLMPRNMDAILRFAAMVADEEREECAKVCDGIAEQAWSTGEVQFADRCAAAIRARKDNQ